MSSIVQMLLLLSIGVQPSVSLPPCPASCVVCSDHALICRRLTHIIEAPNSTQALLLREGSISEVHGSSLSDLSNVTLIGLSHNRISVLAEQPFRDLWTLHTLLLDHNLLTSQALQGGALSNLTHLEVLSLSNNHITMIHGSWFQGSRALHTLLLESNLLRELSSGSFPLEDLRELDTLDLSDNLITHLDTDSFHGLVGLRTLDLSRNRLSSAPAEAFSYLGWLSSLNLDSNTWNCSCELLGLSAFLAAYMQQPDKVLYNGGRMVCANADNPAVTAVLELTHANCVPSNQNITVRVEVAHAVTPQRYARDVAVAAVVCFAGGVGLTLLAVLVYRVAVRARKPRHENGVSEGEEGREGGALHHDHRGGGQRRRRSQKDVGSQADQSQRPRDGEEAEPWGTGNGDNHRGGRIRAPGEPGGGEGAGQFRCPTCRGQDGETPRGPAAGGLHLLRQEEEERRRAQLRYASTRREPGAARIGRETEGGRTDADGYTYGKVSCESCRGKYERAPTTGQTDRPRYRQTDGERGAGRGGGQRGRSDAAAATTLNYLFDSSETTGGGPKREARSVTFERNVAFDLASSRGSTRARDRGDGASSSGGGASSKGKEKGKGRAAKGRKEAADASGKQKKAFKGQPAGRALRVKLNLNPLRRSKVSPKDEKRGKRPKGGGDENDKKRKKKGDKTKSRRKKGSAEEDDEEDDDDDEDEEKSERSSKKKKSSKTKGSEEDKGAAAVEPSQPPPPTTADHPQHTAGQQQPWPPAYMQGPNMQRPRFPFQGNVRPQGPAAFQGGPPGSQPPFSPRSRHPMTPGMARLGSAFPLQGGNMAPNMAYGGMSGALNPNPAPYGAGPESHNFGMQGGFAPNPPAASLLANPTAPANPLQSNPMRAPVLASQPGGLPPNFAGVNPAVNPTSVVPPPVQSLFQTQQQQQQQHTPPDARRNPGSVVTSDPSQQVSGLQGGDRPAAAAAARPVPPQPSPVLTKSGMDAPPQPPQAQGPPPVRGEVPASPLAPRRHEAPGSSAPAGDNVKGTNILPQPVSGGSATTLGMPAASGGPTVVMPAASTSADVAAATAGTVLSLPDGATVAASAVGVYTAGASAVGDSVTAGASAATGGSVLSAGPETGGGGGGGATVVLQQTILSEDGGSSPKRKLRLILPEKPSSRPPTALDKKIR